MAGWGQAQGDDPAAINARAREHLRVGRLDQARDATLKLIAVKPESGDAWFLLGQVYDRRGEQREALDAWRRALDYLPTGDLRRVQARDGVAQRVRALEEHRAPRGFAPRSLWQRWRPRGWSAWLGALFAALVLAVAVWRREGLRAVMDGTALPGLIEQLELDVVSVSVERIYS